jgi:fumarate hydratase subunit beta
MNIKDPEAKRIIIPISEGVIRDLSIGDTVLLQGTMITGRDAAHKWLVDCFISGKKPPTPSDHEAYEAIKDILRNGVIYHCGPVVSGLDTRQYRFVAAGPTTSIREEPYQADVMRHFNLKGVVGKGGMGLKTLKACQEIPAVYFHAIGGAASLIAKSVQRVLGVQKLEFGSPEALWIIEVRDFPAVVTMDSKGNSLHETVLQHSKEILERLIS